MMKHLITCTALLVATAIVDRSTAHGATVLAPPTTVTGPAFSSSFAVDNLFDSAVMDADLGVTEYGGIDGQWAGPGEGPHEIFMDFGASITTSGIAYSQRAGSDPVADKVGTIDLWFSDVDFGGTFPADPADTTALITNTTDTVLTLYSLGGTFSGQYVAARFNAASLDPPTNNPGGTEMRFTIPEPSSLLLFSLAGVIATTALRRSHRAD